MYLGHIVELAACDELFDNPLHPYTQALLAAVPVPDPTVEATRALPACPRGGAEPDQSAFRVRVSSALPDRGRELNGSARSCARCGRTIGSPAVKFGCNVGLRRRYAEGAEGMNAVIRADSSGCPRSGCACSGAGDAKTRRDVHLHDFLLMLRRASMATARLLTRPLIRPHPFTAH